MNVFSKPPVAHITFGLSLIQATNDVKVSCLMEQAFKGFNYSEDNKGKSQKM